jgi:hypothetical protein
MTLTDRMLFKNTILNLRIGHALGLFSVFLAAVPIVYIFHADAFPKHAQTELAVVLGGVLGSLLAAIGAGIVGSSWWFIATLGAVVDVVCLWGFSP